MSRTRLNIKREFAVMLSLVLLIWTTACGNSSGQSESVQDTIEQIEDNSGGKSNADLLSELVTEEPVSGTETEVPEDTTDDAGLSNILIAYFSRVGNMIFEMVRRVMHITEGLLRRTWLLRIVVAFVVVYGAYAFIFHGLPGSYGSVCMHRPLYGKRDCQVFQKKENF